MSETYNPDGTGVIAPQVAVPGLGVQVTLSVPQNTDGVNNNNFAQALKQLGEWAQYYSDHVLAKDIGGQTVTVAITFGDDVAVSGALTVTETAQAASLIATQAKSSASAGAGQAVPVGRIYKDTAPLAWAVVNGNGTLARGANISSVNRSAAGTYQVSLYHAPSSSVLCALPVVRGAVGKIYWSQLSDTQVAIQTYDDATPPVATDQTFSLLVFGGGA